MSGHAMPDPAMEASAEAVLSTTLRIPGGNGDAAGAPLHAGGDARDGAGLLDVDAVDARDAAGLLDVDARAAGQSRCVASARHEGEASAWQFQTAID